MRIRALKGHLHNDTFPLIRPQGLTTTRPLFLVASFPLGQAFKHRNLWRPFLLKPPQAGLQRREAARRHLDSKQGNTQALADTVLEKRLKVPRPDAKTPGKGT